MNSRYPIVELGTHIRQLSQRNRAEADLEVFSVTNSKGFTKSTDYFSKEVFSKDISNYKVVKTGQFAYNPSRINVGSIDYLRHSNSVLVSPLYIVFEGNKEIDADYLLRYLKSDWGNAQIRANTEGAVRDSLKFKGLESIKLPLPLLDDQIRIAHLLGKVEGLIAQRKQHLQELDDLLKSVFLEMFGPRAIGYDDWALVEIKDLAAKHKGSMRTGPFGSNLLHSEFTSEGEVAVLGIDNTVQNQFTWGERRFITTKKYKELENYRIFPGDVIVSIMGTIGRSVVIPDDIPLAVNTKHLAAITVNKEIANPLFLSYSIHSSPFILNQFKSKNRGAIMSGLNLGLIKETKLKRPPIEIQNKFAAIHKKIDRVKSRYKQSLTDLENLYGALSQQAFKGKVDLSQVPLPTDNDEAPHQVEKTPELQTAPETFQLPELPESGKWMSTENRKALIEYWLNAWFQHYVDHPFSAAAFIDEAYQRLLELYEHDAFRWEDPNKGWGEAKWSDDPAPFGIAEYDQIKQWVFSALAAGNLEQSNHANKVQVVFPKRPANWGSW